MLELIFLHFPFRICLVIGEWTWNALRLASTPKIATAKENGVTSKAKGVNRQKVIKFVEVNCSIYQSPRSSVYFNSAEFRFQWSSSQEEQIQTCWLKTNENLFQDTWVVGTCYAGTLVMRLHICSKLNYHPDFSYLITCWLCDVMYQQKKCFMVWGIWKMLKLTV